MREFGGNFFHPTAVPIAVLLSPVVLGNKDLFEKPSVYKGLQVGFFKRKNKKVGKYC